MADDDVRLSYLKKTLANAVSPEGVTDFDREVKAALRDGKLSHDAVSELISGVIHSHNSEALRVLLDNKVVDAQGMSRLGWATVSFDHHEFSQELLKSGYRVDADKENAPFFSTRLRSDGGVIRRAMESGDTEQLKMLSSLGVFQFVPPENNKEAEVAESEAVRAAFLARKAVSNGDIAAFREIAAQGLLARGQTDENRLLTFLAVQNYHPEFLQEIKGLGYDPARDSKAMEPLVREALKHYEAPETLKEMTKAGVFNSDYWDNRKLDEMADVAQQHNNISVLNPLRGGQLLDFTYPEIEQVRPLLGGQLPDEIRTASLEQLRDKPEWALQFRAAVDRVAAINKDVLHTGEIGTNPLQAMQTILAQSMVPSEVVKQRKEEIALLEKAAEGAGELAGHGISRRGQTLDRQAHDYKVVQVKEAVDALATLDKIGLKPTLDPRTAAGHMEALRVVNRELYSEKKIEEAKTLLKDDPKYSGFVHDKPTAEMHANISSHNKNPSLEAKGVDRHNLVRDESTEFAQQKLISAYNTAKYEKHDDWPIDKQTGKPKTPSAEDFIAVLSDPKIPEYRRKSIEGAVQDVGELNPAYFAKDGYSPESLLAKVQDKYKANVASLREEQQRKQNDKDALWIADNNMDGEISQEEGKKAAMGKKGEKFMAAISNMSDKDILKGFQVADMQELKKNNPNIAEADRQNLAGLQAPNPQVAMNTNPEQVRR